MPHRAGITQADRLTVFDNVGDSQDFRMARQQILPEHMYHQRSKAATERHVLLRRDVLRPEYEKSVRFLQTATQCPYRLGIHRA